VRDLKALHFLNSPQSFHKAPGTHVNKRWEKCLRTSLWGQFFADRRLKPVVLTSRIAQLPASQSEWHRLCLHGALVPVRVLNLEET